MSWCKRFIVFPGLQVPQGLSLSQSLLERACAEPPFSCGDTRNRWWHWGGPSWLCWVTPTMTPAASSHAATQLTAAAGTYPKHSFSLFFSSREHPFSGAFMWTQGFHSFSQLLQKALGCHQFCSFQMLQSCASSIRTSMAPDLSLLRAVFFLLFLTPDMMVCLP